MTQEEWVRHWRAFRKRQGPASASAQERGWRDYCSRHSVPFTSPDSEAETAAKERDQRLSEQRERSRRRRAEQRLERERKKNALPPAGGRKRPTPLIPGETHRGDAPD